MTPTVIIEQRLDTQIQISRAPAFGTFTVQITQKDGTIAHVVLDMESTVFILENLDEGASIFKRHRGFFAGFIGKFKKRA